MTRMTDPTEANRRRRAAERLRGLDEASRAKESAATAAVGRAAMGLAGLILAAAAAGLLLVTRALIGGESAGGLLVFFVVAGGLVGCVALLLLAGAVLPERVFTPFAEAVGRVMQALGDLLGIAA